MLSTLLHGEESWAVHMAQAQFECLHDEAPEANPGCQMVASYPQPRHPDENKSSMYKHLYITTSYGRVISSGSTTLRCQSKSSQLKVGHQSIGRPKLCFKDAIKRSLAWKGVPPGRWDKKANNRLLW